MNNNNNLNKILTSIEKGFLSIGIILFIIIAVLLFPIIGWHIIWVIPVIFMLYILFYSFLTDHY